MYQTARDSDTRTSPAPVSTRFCSAQLPGTQSNASARTEKWIRAIHAQKGKICTLNRRFGSRRFEVCARWNQRRYKLHKCRRKSHKHDPDPIAAGLLFLSVIRGALQTAFLAVAPSGFTRITISRWSPSASLLYICLCHTRRSDGSHLVTR